MQWRSPASPSLRRVRRAARRLLVDEGDDAEATMRVGGRALELTEAGITETSAWTSSRRSPAVLPT